MPRKKVEPVVVQDINVVSEIKNESSDSKNAVSFIKPSSAPSELRSVNFSSPTITK